MKRPKPTTADFAFDDYSTDRKKPSFLPIVALILILFGILLLAFLAFSNQYTYSELKRLVDGGSL